MRRRLAERLRETSAALRWGAGPVDRLRIALVMLVTPLRRRLPLGPRAHRFRIRLAPGDVVEWTASSDGDLRVLDEVFGARIYDVVVPEPGTIVDLGAHLGASILFFRRRFPDARIVGFEPDPVTFGRLRRHLRDVPGVEVHNVAIADADGPLEFFSSGTGDSWASSLRRSTRWQEPVVVHARRLDSVLAELGVGRVDLLKIDVEGAEDRILASYAGLAQVTTVLGEVHPDLMDMRLEEFRALLAGFETDLPARLQTDSTAFRAVRTR